MRPSKADFEATLRRHVPPWSPWQLISLEITGRTVDSTAAFIFEREGERRAAEVDLTTRRYAWHWEHQHPETFAGLVMTHALALVGSGSPKSFEERLRRAVADEWGVLAKELVLEDLELAGEYPDTEILASFRPVRRPRCLFGVGYAVWPPGEINPETEAFIGVVLPLMEVHGSGRLERDLYERPCSGNDVTWVWRAGEFVNPEPSAADIEKSLKDRANPEWSEQFRKELAQIRGVFEAEGIDTTAMSDGHLMSRILDAGRRLSRERGEKAPLPDAVERLLDELRPPGD